MNTNDEYRIMLGFFKLGTNIIRTKCVDCRYQSNKVVCIGEDQAFLLKLLYTDDLQWDIQNQKINIIDKEHQNASLNLRCNVRPAGVPILLNHIFSKSELVDLTEKKEEEAIKCYIQSQFGNYKYWDKVCELIVLALAINSCNKVIDRKTLIHFCMNSCAGAILFRKIIIKILSLLIANWCNVEKMKEIAEFLLSFFNDIMNYDYREDIEKNIEGRKLCLCEKIKGSNIDMLYSRIKLQDKSEYKRWKKGGDILEYFTNLDNRDRIYYASRLGLIQRIYATKNFNRDIWLPDNLVQFNREIESTNSMKKLQEAIDSLNTLSESHQEDAIKLLSKTIDACVPDWIDEKVDEAHKFILTG